MSTLFNGLCLDGKLFDSVELFDLTEQGFKGNFHVYGILINGLCKIREIDSTIKLHRRMTCEADMVTCSAKKMFIEMIGKVFASMFLFIVR